MSLTERESTSGCFVMDGKMSLPNQYFAGRVGSRFIISLRDDRKILGVRCASCGKVFVPPREYCEKCMEPLDKSWVELAGSGEVTNWCIVNYNDRHLPRRAPYILALIKLDGADTPFVHILEDVDPSDEIVGMRVKAVFASETTNTILDIDHFEPE